MLRKLFILSLLGISTISFAVFDFLCIDLPPVPYNYSNIAFPQDIINNITEMDNLPLTNPITDAGATLGRVLFYDADLSRNHTIACASCHIQKFGFSDTARFSRGFNGALTARNSMGLIHARFQKDSAFFWDNRAATLEIQTLIPLQSPVEMGMSLDSVVARVTAKPFYPGLFQSAFGSSVVTSDRIAKALAQFIRSINSFGSKFRQGVNTATGNPSIVPFSNFTAEENLGKDLFMDIYRGNCQACHTRNIMVQQGSHNIGLDLAYADNGVGAASGNPRKNGEFSVPSLMNIALTPPYMHDGRYKTLEEVVNFYSDSIENHPNLSGFLKQIQPGNNDPNHVFCDTCPPRRLNYTATEKKALVAFLKTLTDTTITTDVRWSNPFCCGTYTRQTATACDQYTWNGNTYTNSGTFVRAFSNTNGCLSADTLQLTVNKSTHLVFSESTCNTFIWRGNTYSTSGTYVDHYNNTAGCPSADTLKLTSGSCSTRLNVRVFLQGAYKGGGLMNPFLYNSGLSNRPEDVDSVTIEVRNGSTGALATAPVKTILRTNGRAQATLPKLTGSHYVVLKHKNSIEAWSASPINFSDSVNYDFSNAGNKSFGNNMMNMGNNVFALYSGDINQDGAIESTDYLLMENDILQILFGYFNTDLTGDAAVESDDYLLLDQNILRIIFASKPF